jgi:rare lipoprotein A (peptidoglycan hydrolase)
VLGTRRVNAYAYAFFMLLGVLLALPSAALAGGTGGSSLNPTQSTSGAPTSSSTTSPGNVTVSATGNGITLMTNASAMLRKGLSFSGTASSGAAGKTIEIERLGHQTGWQWAPTVTATVAGNGTFTAVWHTNHIGRFAIRALIAQNTSTAAGAAAAPTVSTIVYRPSIATWYGPGLYGRHTACGERLGPATIGLANRTLKCGTKVALYYRGRTMVVPVIDRGPYANHADWDLTRATSLALHTPGVATIGAVSLPAQPPLPFNTR